MKTMHHPHTRAALNLPGLCPVCGEAAPRKVVWDGGVARETYRCAVDGETQYVQGDAVAIHVPGGDLVLETPASLAFLPLEAVAGA